MADYNAGYGRPTSAADVDTTVFIETLQSFLRGELSALETYRIAMKNVEDPIMFKSLSQIESDHQRHVRLLQERLRAFSAVPTTDSGAWGGFAKFVASASSWFGDKAALKTLKEGEEHGLKDYEDGLDKLDSESRLLVQNELIPEQRSHIKFIDDLLSRAS